MKLKACKTIWSQIRGLMFSRRKNLLFVFKKPKYVDLHMLFVFFPIDALYLNENFEIMDIKHMKPFYPLVYKAKYKSKYIIELTEEHKFNVGDKVDINNNELQKSKNSCLL
jgi:hypothetical protein